MTPDPAAAAPQEPGAGPGAERSQGEYVTVRRDLLDAMTELAAGGHEHDERLRAAAYGQSHQAHLAGGYQAGYILGHDTGLSARQDTRAYVHGVLDGFQAGAQQRHQLARELLDPLGRPAADHQADREAEAG